MPSTKFVIRPEDFLVNHLFEDSKFFLEEAKNHDGKDQQKARTYIRASVITSFAALEALVNALLTLIDTVEDLDLHERAFVQEKRVEFGDKGYFEIKGHRSSPLKDKISFLYWRREGKPIPKSNVVWSSFINATKLRNKLVHPKPREIPYAELTVSAARSCLAAVSKVAHMFAWPGLDL